ncbi:class I SAM-dependent methyltransferase [Methylotenera sp. N17]|uniref:class I SAM-dependent methyltransferase n=1 Tax=Methylotenera sp. N17 TaxID=1502761 RepID=UPI00064617AE|nr:class I SAM-dependent methyltransferase [Methylotenera sp. N17]
MATKEDIEQHYDVDNEFYALFLDDKYLGYTCGVWDTATTIEQSQTDKFERLCNYSHVKSGGKVLDVGCGWGGLSTYINENFSNTHVHGLTLSTKQLEYVNSANNPIASAELCAWQDFQPPETKFDAVISIGCLEHFATYEDSISGKQREIYKQFFDWCLSVTTPDAYVGLQTIIITRLPNNIDELRDSWLVHKIFPGSALASISDLQEAVIDKYEISAVSRIGHDYVPTLQAWSEKMLQNKEALIAQYGQVLFDEYLAYFDGARRCFETGYFDLYQVSLKRAQPTRIFKR